MSKPRIADRTGGHSATDPGFLPETNAAVSKIKGWTEQEALYSWFFVAGLNPSVIDQVDEHIQKTRELAGRRRGECLGRDMDCGRPLPCPDHPVPGDTHPSILDDPARTGAAR
jgi:hypothetical protein